MGSLVGGGGQIAVNVWTSFRQKAAERPTGDWLGAKWSPMTKLADQEYENILEEKLLRLDVEIALLDENIAALRAEKEDQAKASAKATSQTPPGKRQA